MKLSEIHDDVFVRGLKEAVTKFPKTSGAQLWWNARTLQAWLSLNEWTDPADRRFCRMEIAKVVGVNNVHVKEEEEPDFNDPDWYLVTKNSTKNVMEGIVAAAKGDIINIVNDSASKIAEAALAMGFPKPEVEFTDSNDSPAIINIQAGQNMLFEQPQTIAITIYGDSEFKIELPRTLAEALSISGFYPQRSADEVVERLQTIRSEMRRFLSERGGEMVGEDALTEFIDEEWWFQKVSSILYGIPGMVAEFGKDGIRALVHAAGGNPKKVVAALMRMGLTSLAYAIMGPLGTLLSPHYLRGVKTAHKMYEKGSLKPWVDISDEE